MTERKRAEEALRESERSLRTTIDGIPGFVGVLAPNGEVEAVNRQILEYCGLSLEELRNWGTNGLVHPDDLPRVAEVHTRSIAAGVPYQFEQRLRRFDGQYRWFDNRGVPIRDDSGRIARWYVLLTDIEDRTQALARLHQMQSDFAPYQPREHDGRIDCLTCSRSPAPDRHGAQQCACRNAFSGKESAEFR